MTNNFINQKTKTNEEISRKKRNCLKNFYLSSFSEFSPILFQNNLNKNLDMRTFEQNLIDEICQSNTIIK